MRIVSRQAEPEDRRSASAGKAHGGSDTVQLSSGRGGLHQSKSMHSAPATATVETSSEFEAVELPWIRHPPSSASHSIPPLSVGAPFSDSVSKLALYCVVS